ncbi:hypothetical protein PRIC2_001875 [Phytophthora ramorum]
METIVLLEAILHDYSPSPIVMNPFKPKESRWLTSLFPAKAAPPRAIVGKVQLIRRKTPPPTGTTNPPHVTYWLHFEGVSVRNDRDLPLYVLLSRSNNSTLDDDRIIRQLEASAQPVLLDCGPEGQWKGSHLPYVFEQELLMFDPMVFASVAIGKPAAAKPPTAQVLIFAYGAFETYVPPTKSPEQIAHEMEALSNRFLQTVMEVQQDQLQGDDELSLDALQRNARQLFRMFDQDKSDSIDFEEYKQMLAYMKVNLLESKAKRFFELVDDQNKGCIDEREFVIAMYITNYLRAHQNKSKREGVKAVDTPQALSPIDVFHQLDGDRDELLNAFEYEKALELLGISFSTKRARKNARAKMPKSAVMSLEQFKHAWVELVDVRAELQKRHVEGFNGMLNQKKSKRVLEQMQNALLDDVHREEQEELRAALQAKEDVVCLEKERRAAEQEESRRLFQQQRHAATSNRTKEALRERQEKIDRKKERVIKDRQAREERRLLDRAEVEAEKRVIHEREVVQDLMMSKMERIIRRKAQYGDDIVDLRGRGLKELPYDLYHGRDALASLSSLLILDLARNQLQSLPEAIFTHLFSLQSLDISDNELSSLPEEIGEARDLQLLDARSNRLTGTPVSLTNLHELRHCMALRKLDLYNNRLRALPLELADRLLAQLEVFSIGRNALTLLPEKTSSTWKLKDQYQTSFTNGYTPVETKAWVADLRVCYPVFVQVWEEVVADRHACESLPMMDEKAPTSSWEVGGVLVTSDEFCKRVEAAMKATTGDDSEIPGSWQPRYERLARHYFYEFKHVGHTIVFDASTQRQVATQNAEVAMDLQRQRFERADLAINECNQTRTRLEAVYYAGKNVLVSATEKAHERRADHEKKLLEHARRDAQTINASVKAQTEFAIQRHEEAKRTQRAKFADEMKRLARERLQTKQQYRNPQGNSSSRRIVAALEGEDREARNDVT